MLKINLLPVREARRKADLRQVFVQFVGVVIVMTLGVALVHSRLADQIDRTQARVNQMQADIEQFKPQLDQVAAFKKRKKELQKKIDVIDGLDRARNGPVRIMDELAQRTPDRLWLTSLDTKGNEITLAGQSLDNEIVALFLKQLGESEYFANVDLESTRLGQDRRGSLKLVMFKVHADIVRPKVKAKQKADADKAKKGGRA